MGKKLFRNVEMLLAQITAAEGSEKMLEGIAHLLVESDDMAALGIVSGRVYRERADDYELIISVSGHGPGILGKTVSKSYEVVREIEKHRLYVISPDTPGFDPELEAQFSDMDSAAILVGREPAYIISLGIRHHGSEDDLLVLLEILRAAIGMKLRQQSIDTQMRQAREIQASLLPSHIPELKGFEIAAITTAAEEVGGDIYNIQPVEEGVLGIMVADASGHGLPAALQARDVVIGMRMGQSENEKITAAIRRMNRVIHNSGLTSRFISMFYGELEDTGNFIYVNGGHVQPLLLTPGGDVFELKTGGPVLGPLPDAVYRRNYVNLRPGEVLVIVSDGVTERERLDGPADADGMREFGREGLIDLVSGILDHTASLIAAEIMRKIKEFGGNQPLKDDATVMVIRRLAAEDYPPAEGLLRLAGPIRR